jgi:hypothetical protein
MNAPAPDPAEQPVPYTLTAKAEAALSPQGWHPQAQRETEPEAS